MTANKLTGSGIRALISNLPGIMDLKVMYPQSQPGQHLVTISVNYLLHLFTKYDTISIVSYLNYV